MPSSELITPHHLARQALIYIRQSTPHQVLTNQESLKLQYALKEKARLLGWREADIVVIDADLGLTGATASHREGFKELSARVTLGQVGIILSSEVMRLSRNCSDWYPLLDICGYRGCLIADRDGIYDPATPNGRLLLGLKGTLSEMELFAIRSRLTAGLLNKAERGELALQLPTGLVRDELGRVQKDPNLEVQGRITLIFETFLRLRSASKVLQRFNAHQLLVPRHNRFGEVIWKKPTVATILFILKNPAYAGAFVYGRTRTLRHAASPSDISLKRLPFAEWRICVHDKYPEYISWATFERIQNMLQDNYAEYDRNKTRGIPRAGKALLHGLMYCGACGHKMVVQYKGGTRYICNYLRQQHGCPVCQTLPADPVDAWVLSRFFEALSPVELDAYNQAIGTKQSTDKELSRARKQQLTRLRYEAELAERQFHRVDPDNRLVAVELERRWEVTLRELKQAEEETARRPAQEEPELVLSPELRGVFEEIGRRLPEIWSTEVLTQPQRKALLRCLIDKVVAHRVSRDAVQVRIVWKGGETTTATVPVTVGALADLSFAEAMEARTVELFHQGHNDETIAEDLTKQGYRSPQRPYVLTSTVKTIRLRHGLMQKRSQSHPRRVPGKLTIPQLTTKLALSQHWLYDRIHKGTIQVAKDPSTKLFLFPDDPATLTLLTELKDGLRQSLRF